MPTRDKRYRCYCTGCCEVDQTGIAKSPSGKLQLERHKAIHLRETSSLDPTSSDTRRAAVAQLALSAVSQQGDMGLSADALSATLFAASLCDNGPDIDSQPSKLWASREEFQTNAPITKVGDPDITDVVGAVGRISLENMFVVFYCSILLCTEAIGLRSEYMAGLMPRKYPLSPPLCRLTTHPFQSKNVLAAHSRHIESSILSQLGFKLYDSVPSNLNRWKCVLPFGRSSETLGRLWLPSTDVRHLLSLEKISYFFHSANWRKK